LNLETWIAFAAASTALLIVPGPTVTIVLSYALTKGRSSAWATVTGATVGDFTAMTLSLVGAGAILAASATLFTILKLIGAAYLIWLGIQLWRADPSIEKAAAVRQASSTRSMFWNCYVVTALNPKSIVFFIAFVPQFVNPAAAALPQFVILEATFLMLAVITLAVWSSLAGQMRSWLQRPRALRSVNRIAGSFLIAAGIFAATARRAVASV
jgi:threonine/homoserine/homoserine lactone efflux protein